MEGMGEILIWAGLFGELVAVLTAGVTQYKVARGTLSGTGKEGAVLEALIAKLPWMAVMGLVTIILGMVLLMNSWPWQVPPTPA
jgi:hypothetical protein